MLILISTFSYSACFCVDWQSKMIYSVIARSSILEYAISKYIVTFLSGGLSLILGTGIFFQVLCIKQPCVMPSAEEINIELSGQAFSDLLIDNHPALYIISIMLLLFFQGALFASIGLLSSVYMPSKYYAYIVPFIVGFALNQIANAMGLPIWLDPVKLGMAKVVGVNAGHIMFMAILLYIPLITALGFIYLKSMKWRFYNG